MKTALSIAALCWFSIFNAQQVTCEQREAIIREQVESHKLEDAYTTFADRGKCSFLSDIAYSDIEKAINFKIETASEEDRGKFINELLAHYEGNDKLVPANTHNNKVRKAALMHKRKVGTPDAIFALLDTAYRQNASNLNDPKMLHLYFSLFVDRYKSAKHKITDDQLFELHERISRQIRLLMADADASKKRSYQSAQSGIRSLMVPIVSCPKLSSYYAKNFDSKKDDAQWLEAATTAMVAGRCTADSLFTKVAYQWYSVQPDANSAYHAGLAAMRKNDRKKAVEYYSAAADLEKDPQEKSRILYTVASSLIASDKELAFDYAKKAIAARPSNGKAYLLMAQIYSGASECAKNEFEKKALNILASQTALKAIEVEPAIKPTAERQAELFLKRGPTSDEIAKAKMGGKTISYDCWIKNSVTIPKA